jgi:RimJ/RimL family protein N-acetyltransferase
VTLLAPFPELLPLREGAFLRRAQPGDAAPLFALLDRSRPFLRSFDAGIGWVGSEEELQRRHSQAEARGGCVYLISSGGAVAGSIAINQLDQERHCAEVGYWVGAPFARQGLASAGLRAVVQVCLDRPEVRAIEATTATTNGGSLRLLERAGFVRERLLPAAFEVDGRKVDDFLYVLLRP